MTTDYFSDFFELDHLQSTTSTSVIKKLKAHFARHGIPEQLVTDNGPQFVSRDFLQFVKEWDFEHFTNSLRHSQANGKAESAVKEVKRIIMKCKKAGSDTFLALLDHRNTPPASVQISPAQRLFSRRTRSLLPLSVELLKPKTADDDLTHLKLCLRKPGSVRKRLDERSYEVQTSCGVLRRNRVHLKKIIPPTKNNDAPTTQGPLMEMSREPIISSPMILPDEEPNLSPTTSSASPSPQANTQESMSSGQSTVKTPVLRRSQRLRKLPAHLKDVVLK